MNIEVTLIDIFLPPKLKVFKWYCYETGIDDCQLFFIYFSIVFKKPPPKVSKYRKNEKFHLKSLGYEHDQRLLGMNCIENM